MDGNRRKVHFSMGKRLKENVADICQRMGMILTTALAIFCRKVKQERRIPSEITADSNFFYSENVVCYLKKKPV